MNTSSGVVHIIDDDASLRKSLARLLRAHGYETELFESADCFIAAGLAGRSGCIILDVHMPGADGLALQEYLIKARCRMPVLFLTGRGDVQKCARAFKAGASDFLTKPVDEDVLLNAVGRALEESRRREREYSEVRAIRERMAALTDREMDVMRHLITGALNKQIGGALDITEKTVKVHRARVMEKMGVSSVADLVRRCAAAGIEPAVGFRNPVDGRA